MTENPWQQDGSYPETAAPQYSDAQNPAAQNMFGVEEPATSKGETAKEESADVARQATDSARAVATTAKTEAANVAAEAKSSARDLLYQAKSELTDQAVSQQQKAASGLRALSDELHSMALTSDQPGIASDLVRQAAERSSAAATWLDGRDPGSLLDEVKSFARQRPGTFLLLAAGAGVLAGRLARGLGAGAPDVPGHAANYGFPSWPAETRRLSTAAAAAGSAVPPPADLPSPDAASASFVPAPGTAVPQPPVHLPGPDATTAGLPGTAESVAGPQTPNPLDSPQLTENPQSRTQIADDPLAGKQLADDPMGSDPRTHDRTDRR
ncbi:hypothetical protein [Arthrobacter sp. ISL-28]|uniref:hypothetical protein n=1 Tax=Arthrobacter sp. ISL-28 TaxID=2819108 RepID=UPI001BE77894|nr:hypothetical protein [Arthrobacter sp. ISL-28]MBT2520277.1 hypothetical protein [Arthrobacter sp. ISL-28]